MAKIASEYSRLYGVPLDRRVLDGCLSALADVGLLRELHGRQFIRTPIRRPVKTETTEAPAPVQPEHETTEEPMSQTTAQTTPAATAADPISRLSDLAHQLRALAEEIDSAALDAQQVIENAGADSKRLAELRALLGIGLK